MASATGSLAVNGAAVQVTANAGSSSAVSVYMVDSSFVGTIAFQASVDNSNWFAIAAHKVLAAGFLGSPQLTSTAAGTFVIPSCGYPYIRVTATAYTSGSCTVAIDASPSSGAGTNMYVNTEGCKPTYSAALNAHAPAATATDFFTLQGSATKTVRVTGIWCAARATAGTQYLVSIRKYSVYLTGGTGSATTIVPHDSSNPTATAVVTSWASGLPTVGTLVGALSNESVNVGVLGTPILTDRRIYDAGRNAQPIVLRGTAQYLALNGNAVALPSGIVLDMRFEWTEE